MRKLSVLMILIFIISVILSTAFSESGPMNQEKYLSNISLRKAIAYAMEREEITSSASEFGFELLPVNYLIPEGFYSVEGVDFRDYESRVGYSYNTEKAMEEWENAKEKLGVSELTLTYHCPNSPAQVALSAVIKEQIESVLLGLTIEVHAVSFPELLEIGDSGNYELLMIGWVPDAPDPTDYLNIFSESGNNWGNYSSEKYNRLLELAESESDMMKRMRILRKAESVLLKDVAIVPLCEWNPRDAVYYLSMSLEGDVE